MTTTRQHQQTPPHRERDMERDRQRAARSGRACGDTGQSTLQPGSAGSVPKAALTPDYEGATLVFRGTAPLLLCILGARCFVP